MNEALGLPDRREVQLVVQGRRAPKQDVAALRERLAGFAAIKGVSVLCDDHPIALRIIPLDEAASPVEVRFTGAKVLDIR